MPAGRPVWGADVPVSMPLPPDEPIMVDMQGFGVTQYRLVHSITAAEYEELAVPVYAPPAPDAPVEDDDYGIDHAPAPGSP
jgi:hypothetical protein